MAGSLLWGTFFVAAGVSNVMQAWFFFFSRDLATSSKVLLGFDPSGLQSGDTITGRANYEQCPSDARSEPAAADSPTPHPPLNPHRLTNPSHLVLDVVRELLRSKGSNLTELILLNIPAELDATLCYYWDVVTWTVVFSAGLIYLFMGFTRDFPKDTVSLFAFLKFQTAAMLLTVVFVGKPGRWTLGIGVSEVVWGTLFLVCNAVNTKPVVEGKFLPKKAKAKKN